MQTFHRIPHCFDLNLTNNYLWCTFWERATVLWLNVSLLHCLVGIPLDIILSTCRKNFQGRHISFNQQFGSLAAYLILTWILKDRPICNYFNCFVNGADINFESPSAVTLFPSYLVVSYLSKLKSVWGTKLPKFCWYLWLNSNLNNSRTLLIVSYCRFGHLRPAMIVISESIILLQAE